MLYNRSTGIYKFGNNTYPRRVRCRLNLGHIFGEKSASYGPGNTVRGYNFYLFHTVCGSEHVVSKGNINGLLSI